MFFFLFSIRAFPDFRFLFHALLVVFKWTHLWSVSFSLFPRVFNSFSFPTMNSVPFRFVYSWSLIGYARTFWVCWGLCFFGCAGSFNPISVFSSFLESFLNYVLLLAEVLQFPTAEIPTLFLERSLSLLSFFFSPLHPFYAYLLLAVKSAPPINRREDVFFFSVSTSFFPPQGAILPSLTRFFFFSPPLPVKCDFASTKHFYSQLRNTNAFNPCLFAYNRRLAYSSPPFSTFNVLFLAFPSFSVIMVQV